MVSENGDFVNSVTRAEKRSMAIAYPWWMGQISHDFMVLRWSMTRNWTRATRRNFGVGFLGANEMAAAAKSSEKDPLFMASLAKGLKVLQCFTQQRPRLGGSDISRLTGLPQPTVWRICHTLTKLGFLIHSKDDQTFTPSLSVITLGFAAMSDLPVIDIAYSSMADIAARYEGAVSIASRSDLEMIYLQRCTGSAVVYSNLRIGSRVPIAKSAPGWAYLAGLKPKERTAVIKKIQKTYGDEWASIEQSFQTALSRYEKTGYIICNGILHPKLNAVAVPITVESPDDQNGSHLVIACGGLSDYFDNSTQKKLGSELVDLVEKLHMVSEIGSKRS